MAVPLHRLRLAVLFLAAALAMSVGFTAKASARPVRTSSASRAQASAVCASRHTKTTIGRVAWAR
jgi:hypothetical protein